MALESESELDKFFGGRGETTLQGRFIEQPVFHYLALIEGRKSEFTRGLDIIRSVDALSGFQTNISQIEVFYPWILKKLEIIKAPLPERGIFDSADRATTLGDKLHRADILFNLIVDRVDALEVGMRLPSHKTEEIEAYQAAMQGISLPETATQEEIEEVLVKAWTIFHSFRGLSVFVAAPLLNQGFINPRAKESVFYGDEIFGLGVLLAKAWAKEAVQAEPISWEFELSAYTQREVLTATNFEEPRLQFIARLDSISRFGRTKKKVDAQIIDLKTGKKVEQNGLAKEIEIRQTQVSRIAAEVFTSRYLRGEKSLAPRREAFYCRLDQDTSIYSERLDLLALRRFDKSTGIMQMEPIEMDETGRREFADWIRWYGAMIHLYRSEMESLRVRAKKAGFHYDLRGISISERDL